ncbi:hypothetical protein [Bacillus cereus]|uniref:hypothetical protein n=1 Tax=Bacillus cereus TaxID=1396 RepID=UPI000BF713AA|nr:hypothetical protein [Bacillus cereus]PFK68277.1 hypothetical protein COJ25_17220 [Bacillus cereus]
MRYTRNRQLRKINSLMASPFTLTIEDSKKHIWNDKLDPTFEWHRYGNVNWVEFNKQMTDWYVSTAILPIK